MRIPREYTHEYHNIGWGTILTEMITDILASVSSPRPSGRSRSLASSATPPTAHMQRGGTKLRIQAGLGMECAITGALRADLATSLTFNCTFHSPLVLYNCGISHNCLVTIFPYLALK